MTNELRPDYLLANREDRSERLHLARRRDLLHTIGVVLYVPSHSEDESGSWRWGLLSKYGWASQQVEEQFQLEMRSLIISHSQPIVSQGLISSKEESVVAIHTYSIGPAAQEWPKIFCELYRDVRPIISDGASLLAWSYFLKDLVKGLWSWASDRERELHADDFEAEGALFSGTSIMPKMVFTYPAVLALCYGHLIEHYHPSDDLVVESFPRTSVSEFAAPEHPGGYESYLIRATAGRKSYYYLVTGEGKTLEHYLLVGKKLTPLELPNFVDSAQRHLDGRLAMPPLLRVRGGGGDRVSRD